MSSKGLQMQIWYDTTLYITYVCVSLRVYAMHACDYMSVRDVTLLCVSFLIVGGQGFPCLSSDEALVVATNAHKVQVCWRSGFGTTSEYDRYMVNKW
jgi:hypothetical protein